MSVSRYLLVRDYRNVKSDALAILLFKGESPKRLYADVDEGLRGLLSRVVELGDFKGDINEVLTLYNTDLPYPRIIMVGGGDVKEASYETLRVFGGHAVSRARSLGISKVSIALRVLGDPAKSLRAIAEGAILANYTFSKYKKDVKLVKEIEIVGKEEVPNWESIVNEVNIVGEAYKLSRDLANSPPEDVNPDTFENYVRDVLKDLPVNIKVLSKEEIVKEGLNGILAVGKGSVRGPKLLIMEYRGGSGPWYAVVGKGVCFDAGGLNLKRDKWIAEMKFDKSGAASVVGIIYAAAKLKLPINLVGLVPLVENLPSGSSYKPGDIIKMYNGLTVEVVNTDAEGRLILADAIAYAIKNYKPEVVIDLATLTGAIVVALGNQAAGLFTNDESLAKELEKAAEESGERVWRLPLWKEYFEDIKSEVADIKNLGVVGAAGAQAGAAFLAKFAEEAKWAHLDIASTAWTQEEGPKKPYYPKGATGFGIRLVLTYLKSKVK